MNRLNVGCGSDSWGDVRLDVSRNYLHYHTRPNIIGDAQHLPFRSHVFDKVKSSHLIEHLPDLKRGLDEMLRVNNSTLYLTFPIRDFILHVLLGLSYLNWKYMREGFQLRTVPLHVWRPNLKSILAYLERRGFTIQKIEKGYRTFLHRKLRRIGKHLRIHTEYSVIATRGNHR